MFVIALIVSSRSANANSKRTANANAKHVIAKPRPSVLVDWTRGVITAKAAAVADLYAPSIGIARVGANHRAQAVARTRLKQVALSLRIAAGETVADTIGRRKQGESVLAAAIDNAKPKDIGYSSDGSVQVQLQLPLETIRRSLIPRVVVSPQIVASSGPSALVIDAREFVREPRLHLSVAAGNVEYAGPTVFYYSTADAKKDPRAGKKVMSYVALGYKKGRLFLSEKDGKAAKLASAPTTGPLILIVISKK